jgi:hypothetical protein
MEDDGNTTYRVERPGEEKEDDLSPPFVIIV